MSRVRKLYAHLVEAIQRPNESAQLRRQVLFFVPLPIPMLAIVALLVGGRISAPGWMILLSGSVAVAALLLAVIVQPSPLPEGLSAQASVRRSLHRFQQITTLRICLALTPVVVGAGTALAGGGLLPLFVSLALAWPQLLLALPTFFTITRARRAMEAWGTRAYLWAGLAQPSRVTWPIVTSLTAQYRQYQERRAQASAHQSDAQETEGGENENGTTDAESTGSETSTGSELPERMASSTTESKADPGNLIPGFPVPGAVASPARRILRSGDGLRRRVPGARGNRRPTARS